MSRAKRADPVKAKRREKAAASPSALPEQRVLILAPTGNDAPLAAGFLSKAGVATYTCDSGPDLFAETGKGCGAILLAEEALAVESISILARGLAQQPAWSDIPVVIITSGGEATQMQLRRIALFGSGGNVSLLERPFRPNTLVATIEAALRARKRQYEVRDLVQALRTSEERLRNFHESSHDCIKELDLRGRLLSMNKHGQRMIGMTDFSRFYLQAYASLWTGKERRAALLAVKEAQAGRVARFQGQGTGLDGVQRWWDVMLSPVFDATGKPERILATSRDITETKRQEESLAALTRQIEKQAHIFNTTLSHIRDFAYIFDRQGRFLYVNQPLLDLWGLPLEQAVGKNFHQLNYPAALAKRLQEQIEQVFKTRETVRGETPYTSETGVMGYYEYIFNPVLGRDGRVEMVAGSTREVTERKQHEADLAELLYQKDAQARLFDATLSSINDLAYTFDLEGNWIYANKPLLKLWGKSLKEITGKSSLQLGYPPELAKRLKDQVKEVVRTRKPVKGETYFTDAAGREDYHEYIFSPVLTAEGKVSAVCGTTRLTTERKRAEAVAEGHKQVLQLMVEDAPLGDVLDALMRTVELDSPVKVFASILLLDSDGVHLRHGAAPSLPESYNKALDGTPIGPEIGSCAVAAFTKQPVYVSDIATDKHWAKFKHLALAQGLRSCWSVPILSTRGEVLGTFALYHTEVGYTHDDDRKIIEMATRTASIAIERKKSDAAVRESQRRYSQLVNSLPVAVYTTDAQGRITLFNEEAVTLWGRKSETGKEHWCGSHRIFRPDGTPLALDECPMAVTLREGRAIRGEEILIERPDGTRRNVLPYPDPIYDSAGKLVGAVNMLLDITDSKRAEEASRRLAAIVETSDDAIFSKDLNGYITSWNQSAERLLGYQADEVLGKHVTMLMPPERWNEEPNILDRIRRGERVEHYETIRQRKDGTRLEISLTVSPIKDAEGKIIGASKILRDITRQNQAKRELERAHVEAVAASRAKDDFLAALSHELRTPLNPVLLLASEAAEDDQLPPGVRAQFATIRNNVELEARLIDDLLDITRITHGKLPLTLELVNVHTLLNDATAAARADIDQKKIALTMELAAKPCTVKGDAVRLQQVFWNVIKNAAKFTPEKGKITISTRADTKTGELMISVQDTGIGMTPTELERIFEAFAQGDHVQNRGSHRFGGLGLGLAISQKLMESHAGTIRALSAGRGQGSTFILTLPLMMQSVGTNGSPKVVRPPAAHKAERTESCNVLLVEDHEPTRTALAQLLTRRHYDVSTAASLAEARALCVNHDFQLLISDIGLPDGNGFELMKELLGVNKNLRGIALTGYGMEEDIARSREAGFASHLTKPIRVQSLEAALAALNS